MLGARRAICDELVPEPQGSSRTNLYYDPNLLVFSLRDFRRIRVRIGACTANSALIGRQALVQADHA